MAAVALVTSHWALTSTIDADVDLWPLRDAFVGAGAACELIDWRRSGSDLGRFDLVVIKSPWDYSDDVDEFLGWLDAVASGVRVLNDPGVIRWSLDKTYLADLADRGVAVCPTTFCSEFEQVRAALAAASGRVVIKPTVSAASANTGLFEADDPGAEALGRRILGLGKTVMVQPALASVSAVGENALIHLDGSFVHAVTKGPLLALGGGLLGGEYQETLSPVVPAQDERELASSALSAAAEVLAGRGVTEPLLHARVDIARDDSGAPVILELELFEPLLSLAASPGAVELYAARVLARLAP